MGDQEDIMRVQRMMAAVAVAMAILAAVVQAADVTGKWTGAVPTRDGGTREATFNFKQDGEKLTGTMTGPQGDIELKDGAVKGDDVSFNVALSFGGNDVKLIYKGKVAGDEIKFTRTREGADQTQQFTVKRAK
jgi:opacity protein-like surface antigen